MSSADVAQILGSPNIVSTDEERREVWIYDKMATDRAYSSSAGGVNVLILGFGSSSEASSTSQRTLTVVIKFDKTEKSETSPITHQGFNDEKYTHFIHHIFYHWMCINTPKHFRNNARASATKAARNSTV